MLAATLEYSTPRETDRATVTSTLLTQIDDALTAAAIVIGGAFAYLKFIKGRVLTAAVGYEIRASVTAHAVQRRHMPRQPLVRPDPRRPVTRNLGVDQDQPPHPRDHVRRSARRIGDDDRDRPRDAGARS